MRAFAFCLSLLALLLAGCDAGRPSDELPVGALVGSWNGTLLRADTAPDPSCDGAAGNRVTLTLDLRRGSRGSASLTGEGTLDVGTEEGSCSTVRAGLTDVTYAPPRLRLEFGEQFVFDGEITETDALDAPLIEGELTWRDGLRLPFTVARGSRLFVVGSPFESMGG